MATQNDQSIFIIRNMVNSFRYLYTDAEYLLTMAKAIVPEVATPTSHSSKDDEVQVETLLAMGRARRDRLGQNQLCRTALILFVFSLEGLINRALDHFLPEPFREFLLEREDKLTLEDKWLLLPLVASGGQAQFDKSRYPWSHFRELVQLRNDFVHPKHDRVTYYQGRFNTYDDWQPLSWKEIPSFLDVKEGEIVYRQTTIPKNPYAIGPEHVAIAKKVVDDIINELDRLLEGKIRENKWYREDQYELIYPQGKIGTMTTR